jgi:uncharacterized phage-associated protein
MKETGYSPIAVANYYIAKSLKSGVTLSPMKLIKLVYIAHGWHLARKGEPLLSEGVQAWKFGPVIESLYHAVKRFGDRQITSLISVPTGSGREIPIVEDGDTRRFLDSVWDSYSKYSGVQLSTLTHRADTAWYEIWHCRDGKSGRRALIPNDLITEHYRRLEHAA